LGKNAAKRKQLRRKYKRHAAALMGAAIMTGAALTGLPVTKAMAAESPTTRPPIKTEQAVKVTKDTRPPGHGWHQHKYSWPSADENQAWYQDGKIYYRSDSRHDRYDRHHHHYLHEYGYRFNNPVNYVKYTAATYGFDSTRDTFTLLTVNSKRALVEVRKNDTGKLFNVLLERTYDRDWNIVNVRAL
jgi:hypothetical protein